MMPKPLCAIGILCCGMVVFAQHRWLGPVERLSQTDGVATEFLLPNPGSGPTTIALAADGTVWFTESAGNRIGRMNPDGSGLWELALPNANSSPRIIALGADGNMWFSEHTGGRMGRITMKGEMTEFPIPSQTGSPLNAVSYT